MVIRHAGAAGGVCLYDRCQHFPTNTNVKKVPHNSVAQHILIRFHNSFMQLINERKWFQIHTADTRTNMYRTFWTGLHVMSRCKKKRTRFSRIRRHPPPSASYSRTVNNRRRRVTECVLIF